MADRHDAEIAELKARVTTLEQLLEVYERSVIEQSDKLYSDQERIRFQKSLLESQGEASIDGILSVGVDGTILFANQRLVRMWEIPAPVVGEKSFERILERMSQRVSDSEAFLERCSADTADGESRHEIPLRDGRTIELYIAPIRSQEGQRFGHIWHFRDISASKAIDRSKDEFISAVSHELRTPLTSIRGSIDLLSEGVMGEFPAEAGAVLKVAQKNCDRLGRIINDVLDIQKIEAGRMDFEFELLDIEDLLAESVDAIRPYGDRLGVQFAIDGSAGGVRVRVDSNRLIQVMDNLLSNAAKFSPLGAAVLVKLSRERGRVCVSVEDRGPGIAPEFRGRLFEKFSQGGGKVARDTSGTGLGLNIARAIVERLDGTIGFRPRPGGGAIFYFDLPEANDSSVEELEP